MNYKFIPVFFSVLLLFQCSKDKNEIVRISYGMSFGECLGYCYKEMDVCDDKVLIELLSSNINEAPMTCSGNISDEEWNDLVNSVDINEFFNLEEVIGCPDCADGGAEWIEIKKGDAVHKVTFEYGNAPAEVAEYIDKLRSIYFLTWDQCYPEEE